MKKMFILCRRDILPLNHCAVQCSHSVSEFMFEYGHKENVSDWVKNHKTMILLSASEKQINEMKDEYTRRGLSFKTFIEPDMSYAETATTFEPLTNEDSRGLFSHLSLLR